MRAPRTPGYDPRNAVCTRCGRRLVRLSLNPTDPTAHQRALAAQPHQGCGGRVVPIRQETRR